MAHLGPVNMDSLYGTSEIVELKEEFISKGIQRDRALDKERKPPVLKQGYSKALDDDINKLFEAINLRSPFNGSSLSEEIGGLPTRKNASKKPMRMSTSSSSGIEFSEPVSLKQALRGLCISQASEMAAMKRLSKPPGSPAVSESGKLANVYRSVVVNATDPHPSLMENKLCKVEMSLVSEESRSNSSGKIPQYLEDPTMKLYDNSAHSSPRLTLETAKMRMGTKLRQNGNVTASNEAKSRQSITVPEQGQKNISSPSPLYTTTTDDALKSMKRVSGSFKLASSRAKSISSSSKFINKAAPKLRRKGRLQSVPSSSNSVNSSKISNSVRNAPRTVKAAIRNKNFVKKKSKQALASASGTFNTSIEIKADLNPHTSQLICQRCHCTLKDVRKESVNDSVAASSASISAEVRFSSGNNGVIRQGSTPGGCSKSSHAVVNHNGNSKSGDKGEFVQRLQSSAGEGEFTQSSQSSMGEFSSSTSISEESNLSGCSIGNRPHMSKDMRWQAIHHAMKQNGFIGLRHFNLLKKLGCGDIGTVYLAELIGTNILFAIKVMDNEFLERRKKMPRAQTEREILRILDHPFLPTLYAHFISENLSCLVMEYCPGGDLHVLRQKQPGRYFHEQAARFYVAEVLLALEYLHMLGIVYRDLKPENILVREDGHIMLTDFDLSLRCSVSPTLLQSPSQGVEPPRMSGPCAGSSCIDPFCIEPTCQVSCFRPRILPIVKARKPKAALPAHMRSLPQLVAEPTDARSNSFVGTHEYLAPEIIKGDGHGSAVDWWTFGIFLYELLYGKTPFKGSGNDETLANVVLQSLKFPDTPLVSFQARDLIKGLLVKEPENRLGSERGAAEIKQHPFFDGLNWALIRCAIPPELPEPFDIGVPKSAALEKAKKYLRYDGATGGHLEFELF